ncbi:MAG: hypothetical protein HYY31_06450, partial [Chloroflexi bacterium]|nr:hypothetical protein [Chloroflexota bacterium]
MRQHIMKRPLFWGGALMAALSLLAAACSSSGVPTKDYDAAKAEVQARDQQLQAKDQEIAKLQNQVKGQAPTNVVQAGQLQPAPASAQPTGWDTAESIRGGVKLFAKYDSSGPDAWNAKAHPLVYFTSEGMGYGHRPSKANKLPGVQVIDANSKQVIASAQFDLGLKQHGTPHGLGTSPDGKWVYIATGDGAHAMTASPGTARMLVINARTLKL